MKSLKMKNDVENSIKDMIKIFLEKGIIDAVFIPILQNNNIIYSLIREEKHIDKSNPLAPVIQTSSASEISKITRLKPLSQKIGVVIKPCEYRALVELVKFQQINLDNIITIVPDCVGTVHARDFKATETKDMLQAVRKSDNYKDLRDACKACINPISNAADITIEFLGDDKNVTVTANSSKGEKAISILDLKDSKSNKDRADKLIKKREQELEKIIKETSKNTKGIVNLENYFTNCINCHNCKTACPICFCKECFFDSHEIFDYSSDKYLKTLERKGSMTMPTDKLLFHVGRMIHMASSCVNCGLCSQACPMDIPVFEIFATVSKDVQKIFDYMPGNNLNEDPPIMTFREEELEGFEGGEDE